MNPTLGVDLGKIEANTRAICQLAKPYGIEIMGVTKGVSALPDVARAMLTGGAVRLGDSRLSNLLRLRESGISAHMTLLRSPMLSEARHVPDYADRCLVSDVPVLGHLDEHARRCGKTLEVVLMVDLGDLREGFWPDREAWTAKGSPGTAETIDEAAKVVLQHDSLRLVGVGVNLACFGAIIPTREKMLELVRVRDSISRAVGIRLAIVSGGNSANLGLLLSGDMPQGITELRIGEALLLGTEAVEKKTVPGCHTDAFTLTAEVIEVRTKPSKPIGESGIDAFGAKPHFDDRGIRRRAILAVGRQDVDWQDMRPRRRGIEVLGASSDHLVIDVTDASPQVCVGDEISFDLGYACLLRASTSHYVCKVAYGGG